MGFIQRMFAKRMMKKYNVEPEKYDQFSGMIDQVDAGQYNSKDIMATVMAAREQAGDDPQKLAEILQKEFGGENTIVMGSGAIAGAGGIKFGPDGEVIPADERSELDPGEMSGPGSEVQEPTGMLGQLEKMRDNGAISNEQFEEQKKRLQGE